MVDDALDLVMQKCFAVIGPVHDEGRAFDGFFDLKFRDQKCGNVIDAQVAVGIKKRKMAFMRRGRCVGFLGILEIVFENVIGQL